MSRDQHRIIGVGLLTAGDLERLGRGFDRWYPVDETPCFHALLVAIDDADRELIRKRDADAMIMRNPTRTKMSPDSPWRPALSTKSCLPTR